MDWLWWIYFTLRVLAVIAGVRVGYRAIEGYLRKEYPKAIFDALILIFIAICLS